jgi:dTDP-glucose 4,6-dehydratase
VHGNIADRDLVSELLSRHSIRGMVHFAAESHVDRSIHGPEEFIQTNVVGTFHLLESARAHWNTLEPAAKAEFRFLHVSTDEVYGSLAGRPLPIYSDGQQIRDWLYVRDHYSAIRRVLDAGQLGQAYNIGG